MNTTDTYERYAQHTTALWLIVDLLLNRCAISLIELQASAYQRWWASIGRLEDPSLNRAYNALGHCKLTYT